MIEREVGKNTPQQSYPDYVDLRDRSRSFDGVIAYTIAPASLNITGNPSSIWLYGASGNYFDVLGVQPYLGRFFHASDEHGVNSAAYIVLSYAYWQSHFQGDPGVVGRTVQLNKYPYTILGIAPPNFRGSELFFAPDLWAPLVNQQQLQGWNNLDSRAARGMWLVGRLKAGKTPAQATAELSSIASTLAKAYPNEDDGIRFHLARPGLLGDALGGPVRAFVAALMLLAGLILVAACANLGSLFAARAADRSREVALRLALGSSRRRIVRQLLTEAVLVSLAGGALGLFGGVALLRWLSTWQPVPNIPINVAVNPDALDLPCGPAAGAGERFAVRHGSGTTGVQGRSLPRHQGQCSRDVGHAASHLARPAARGTDHRLCGARHRIAGCGARSGAVAA